MQKLMGRRRQQDLFPRGFTTMTREVVVVVVVVVVIISVWAIVYAKLPRQAQAARFVFPGLYKITTRKRQISLVFFIRNFPRAVQYWNRWFGTDFGRSGTTPQNDPSETSDFLTFFIRNFPRRFSTEIDDLGPILDDEAHPPNSQIMDEGPKWRAVL